MRDRGTLIAGAGIALACLIAGVAYLVFARQDAAQLRDEEFVRTEAEHLHAEAFQHRFEMNRKVALEPQDAIAAGANHLIQQQSADGAWRSETYATFKSGTALTPLVVTALQAVYRPGLFPRIGRDPIASGCDYLAQLVKPDGIEGAANGDLDFPVYTAALSVIALSHPDQKRHEKARDAWLKFLLRHQLTEANGWTPADKPYGGWGYCRLIPKKPEPGAIAPPLVESNLSATVFALEALKAAGVTDKNVYSKALAFVRRCQNLLPIDSPTMLPPAYDDGGFTFIYDDPVRNKAGAILPRASSRDAFNSYGSATADGLRALRLAGETDQHRIEGAERWLKKHFRAEKHPGTYIPAHEPNRNAVYFYYAASVSKALRAANVDRAGEVEWSPALVAELVKRQKPDGSWSNPVELVRENEPLVATSNALIALANCTVK